MLRALKLSQKKVSNDKLTDYCEIPEYEITKLQQLMSENKQHLSILSKMLLSWKPEATRGTPNQPDFFLIQ